MDDASAGEADEYLDRLKSGRKSPAVLKLRLAQFRVTAPDITVFALEGDDDKVIYSQWIRRIRPTLQYEPFPCDGKAGVLMLRGVVLRDLGNLGKNIYFFLDRDYDDLRDVEHVQCIFMTDSYSVENYLVSEEVLVELLRNEFHCHGRPDIRESIRQVFSSAYDEFLVATREINRRIFVARRLGIKLKHQLPAKPNAIAHIELNRIRSLDKAPEEVVVYLTIATPAEFARLSEKFDSLDPRSRYRGKFALTFFQRWLSELADEFSTSKLGLFAGLDVKSKVRISELVVSNFASKSELPIGLKDFIQAV